MMNMRLRHEQRRPRRLNSSQCVSRRYAGCLGRLRSPCESAIKATPSTAFLCSLLALLLWALVGFLIACRLPIGRDMRLAVAPALGWAVQDVSALQVSMLGGFTPVNLLAATALIGLAAFLAPASRLPEIPGPSLPMWIFAAAALVAAGPAAGILPKISTAASHSPTRSTTTRRSP
jgi:hypothetical protein